MDKNEQKWIEKQFCEVHEHLQQLHDDVLVLKTQRDLTTKFVACLAGVIAFIVTIVTQKLWR